MRFAPVVTLLARQARTVRALRRELAAERRSRLTLEVSLERTLRALEQTERDVEIVALFARDRTAALEFVKDAHTIDNLDTEAS